ncbi:MAG TPA: hypothetical protein VLF71_01085 [Candidatus Saccharimonadales bacterium]|nr:hypothetical protein [Candidatus Saccharimonadales bacterium]
MEREDLHTLAKELRNPPTQLPLHQKALRKQLLKAHAARLSKPCPLAALLEALHAYLRAVATKRALPLGIALVVAIVLLGLLLVLPGSHAPSHERLIAKVPIANPAVPEAAAGTVACGHAGTCPGAVPGNSQLPPAVAGASSTITNPGTTASPGGVTASPAATDAPASVAATPTPSTGQGLVAATIEAVVTPLEPSLPASIDINLDQTLTGKNKPKQQKAAKAAAKAANQANGAAQDGNAQ